MPLGRQGVLLTPVFTKTRRKRPTFQENDLMTESDDEEQSSSGTSHSDEESEYQETGDSREEKKIGNGVSVDRGKYELIDFYNPLKAVTDLCMLYYGKKTMATHSVTGGQGPTAKNGQRKPRLPPKQLSIILNHVLNKFEKLHGPRGRILDKNGERIPLTQKLLRQAVMKKCYACAAH